MSGRKFTYVDSSELASLRRDASRLRALREDLPERIENAVRETQASINARLAPIEARQRDFSRAIQGINQDIRQVEQNMAGRIAEQAHQTNQALQQQAAHMERQRRELRQELHDTAQQLERANQDTEKRLTNRIQDTANQLTHQIQDTERRLLNITEDIRDEMNNQGQRLSEAISQERQAREAGLAAANHRIDAIHADRQRITGIARERIEAARVIHDFIRDNYKHEHFTPHQLTRLEHTLAAAQDSMNQGASEAALAEANRAYQGLSDLRLELERLDAEWRILQQQALHNAGRLIKEAQANRRISGVEGTSEIAEADFWTDGKLTSLETELNTVIGNAENERKLLTIAELRELVEKKIPEMDHQLDDIVAEAQMAILRSQNRTNIADLAMQALKSIGYGVEGGVYEGQDMRAGFVAKAKNKVGSEVVVTIVPEGDRERVSFDSFEPIPVPHSELQKRAEEVTQVLSEGGLDVTKPVMESESPSAVNRNLEEVRARKVQVKKRQK